METEGIFVSNLTADNEASQSFVEDRLKASGGSQWSAKDMLRSALLMLS